MRVKSEVDGNYLKTDEAKRILEITAYKAKDETRREKINMLKDFLVNSSKSKYSSYSEKDMILDVIDRISPFHLRVLKAICNLLIIQYGVDNLKIGSDYNAEDKISVYYMPEKNITGVFKSIAKIAATEIETNLDYLNSIGLIEGPNERGWILGKKRGERGFRPTKLGIKTLEFLGSPLESMTDSQFQI